MNHTHRRYVQGCPVCELNAAYCRCITLPGITAEQRQKVDSYYRRGAFRSLRALEQEIRGAR